MRIGLLRKVSSLPPRHRKMRSRTVDGIFTAQIREITAAEAPVVLRVHGQVTWAKGIHANDYRQYDGQLYTMSRRGFYCNCHADKEGEPLLASEFGGGKYLHVTASYEMEHHVVAERMQEAADQWLFIDGVAWKQAPEPFYQVRTFGLGNNQGGTALVIVTYRGVKRDEDCFSALQEKEARKAALAAAKTRGDTYYYDSIKDERFRIEVLDPSAVKFQRDEDIFCVEKIVRKTVFVRACSYAEAVKLAKQIPDERYAGGEASYAYPAKNFTEEAWQRSGLPCFVVSNTDGVSVEMQKGSV